MSHGKNYGKLEMKIIDLVKANPNFQLEGENYKAIIVDKPRPNGSSGEPKTDVFILAESNGSRKEIKISVKSRKTNEFQENKISADRAESIFGMDYERIIENSARSIEDEFRKHPLVYASGRHPTKPILSLWVGN